MFRALLFESLKVGTTDIAKEKNLNKPVDKSHWVI